MKILKSQSQVLVEFFINDEKRDLAKLQYQKKWHHKIGKILSGNRIYLAVFGGFDIKKSLEIIV